MKRIYIFQIICISLFLLFLIILFLPKNYSKKYTKNDIEISEAYNKKNKNYYFTFKYNDITLDYLVESNYHIERSLIKNIEVIEDENNNFCIIPSGDKLAFIPLCYQDKESIHYSLVNKDLKEQLNKDLFKNEKLIETYKDIEIYNNSYTYLLWNYDGFYYLNETEKKKIDIFDKELYNISLVGYTKDYLVLADYDSNYTFNKMYTIDFKKGNLKKYDLNRDIYFDSYFIGYEKNKIYIVDNKESTMYEWNAKNGELSKISSKVLKDSKWENVSIKTLLNKKETFSYKSNFNYELEDNNLYLDYKQDIKTLVDINIKSIIKTDNEDIFYLKDSELYHFSPEKGIEKLLNYFEWNFNFERMIYIY